MDLRLSIDVQNWREGQGHLAAETSAGAGFLNGLDAARLKTKKEPSKGFTSKSAALSQPFRIRVTQTGVYRLDHFYLTSRGFVPGAVDPRNLRLTSQGLEIPIYVEGEADGSFGTSDAIVFYGQSLTGENDVEWNGGDFTDENVYWLSEGTSPGVRMGAISGSPTNGYTQVTQVPAALQGEVDSLFSVTSHFRPNGDTWYWSPIFGYSVNKNGDYPLNVPNPVGSNATVTATLAAFDSADHAVSIRLNGLPPASGADPLQWTGAGMVTATWTFSSGLANGPNVFRFIGNPARDDAQVPDRIDVSYTRSLLALSNAIEFGLLSTATRYRVGGLSSNPWLLDVTNRDPGTRLALPQRVTGASYAAGFATFERGAGASSRSVALSSSPLVPAEMVAATARDLASPALAADLVIITHPDFHPVAGAAEWQSYLARRGAALDVEVVDIQEIYDQFSDGVFDPVAIRRFLAAAAESWATAPRYVLLVGDGTWDYKDAMNRRATEPTYKNWVPTMMFEDVTDSSYFGRYPSDAWYADVDDDGYPNMAVGRLPVRTYAQLEGVLQKIAAYEDQALTGTWHKSVHYVADSFVQQWEQDAFEGFNDWLQATFTVPPYTNISTYYHDPPFGGTDSEACAATIRDRFDDAALLHYSGHGGIQVWGKYGVIFSSLAIRNSNTQSDIDLLPSTTALPFVLNANCFTSAFDDPASPSLMESLVVRANAGSIGSTGASTIAYVAEEEAFSSAWFTAAFGSNKMRTVGDLAEVGRFAQPSSYSRGVFSLALLGDPSLRLRLPAPAAPTDLSAVGGNAVIDLSWTTAGAAAGFHVYRSDDFGSTWTRLTVSPLPMGATSYTDAPVLNGCVYLYYVVAQDGDGFESSGSNIAQAIALNPAAPMAPAGVGVSDPGTGVSLVVSWSLNPEPDIFRYVIEYGIASGQYTRTRLAAPSATSVTVTGLTAGVTYYSVVKARNTSNMTSSPSVEISAAPTSNAPYQHGDLDQSGVVNATDLVTLANYLVGNVLPGNPSFSAPIAAADLNVDGEHNATDLVIMANFLVGNVAGLPSAG